MTACNGVCESCANDSSCGAITALTDPDNECPGGDTCDGQRHCRCFNGKKDDGETGVDCGGMCPPCGGTCSDGVQNNGEPDVDCGGANCPTKCAPGKGCAAPSDCDQALCFKGKCCVPDPVSVTCAGKDCGTATGNCGQIADCGSTVCPAGEACVSDNCASLPWLGDAGNLGGAGGAGGGG